ncbi:hypothetical protein OSTOST_24675 [Ostertagia ostertagi]
MLFTRDTTYHVINSKRCPSLRLRAEMTNVQRHKSSLIDELSKGNQHPALPHVSSLAESLVVIAFGGVQDAQHGNKATKLSNYNCGTMPNTNNQNRGGSATAQRFAKILSSIMAPPLPSLCSTYHGWDRYSAVGFAPLVPPLQCKTPESARIL